MHANAARLKPEKAGSVPDAGTITTKKKQPFNAARINFNALNVANFINQKLRPQIAAALIMFTTQPRQNLRPPDKGG